MKWRLPAQMSHISLRGGGVIARPRRGRRQGRPRPGDPRRRLGQRGELGDIGAAGEIDRLGASAADAAGHRQIVPRPSAAAVLAPPAPRGALSGAVLVARRMAALDGQTVQAGSGRAARTIRGPGGNGIRRSAAGGFPSAPCPRDCAIGGFPARCGPRSERGSRPRRRHPSPTEPEPGRASPRRCWDAIGRCGAARPRRRSSGPQPGTDGKGSRARRGWPGINSNTRRQSSSASPEAPARSSWTARSTSGKSGASAPGGGNRAGSSAQQRSGRSPLPQRQSAERSPSMPVIADDTPVLGAKRNWVNNRCAGSG